MAKIVPPFVRAPGNYDVVAAADECCVQDFGPSLTIQSQAEEADINTIVKRFGLTGQLPENVRTPTYADFDSIVDYKTAMDAITGANSAFNRMPAAIRARFDNDPSQFVDYCSNPDNVEELTKMGLAVPRATQAPQGATTGAGPGGEPAKPGTAPGAVPGGSQTA